MQWLGSWIFNILFYATTVILSLVMMIVWPLGRYELLQSVGRFWSRLNQGLLRVFCGITLRVEGREKLPEAPYVIMSKHQSAWETVAFPALFPSFVYVLKKSLLNIPLFGWVLRALREIAIDRSLGIEALKQVRREGAARLAEGLCVVVFPEGTRSAPGTVGDYNPSGVLVALEAGVPIVPVAHNAGSFWRRKAFIKAPGEVHLKIGDPISTAGMKPSARKKLLAEVKDSIEGMMGEIGPV